MLSAFASGCLIGLGVAFGFFVGCLVFAATANVLAAKIQNNKNNKVRRSLVDIMKGPEVFN